VRLALGAVLLLSGCYQELAINDPDGSPPPFDAARFVDAGPGDAGRFDGGGPDAGDPSDFVPPVGKCGEATGVDLLLLVDNSNSMTEEQQSLAAELPALVRSLVEPPDSDGDGEPDWLPITDLRIGVITTDMGTGGFTVPTCARSDFGDDGVLRTQGNVEIAGCTSTYPSFASFDPAIDDPTDYANDVACVATTGTGGCGFEQPLEAVLKSLSPDAPTAYTRPDYVAPGFFSGTSGHGLGANAGFVRPDTLLAVVLVTDEEDCSASDPDLYNPTSPTYGATDLNLRCFAHPEAVHPIERYVDGLAALRANRPDLLAFGLIAGVPTDLAVSQPRDADFARILGDPRMTERVDPAMPTRLVPSCNVPGRGLAFPPRRLVRVAQRLTGFRSTVQSICQEDFSPAAEAIARLIGTRACAGYIE